MVDNEKKICNENNNINQPEIASTEECNTTKEGPVIVNIISQTQASNEKSNGKTSQHRMSKGKKILVLCLIFLLLLGGMALHFYRVGRTNNVVTSEIKIDLDNLKKTKELHVLHVTDSQVIAENAKDNKDGISAWTQFTGRCDFIIDLSQCETIVDNIRKTVIIRTAPVSIDRNHFTLEYGNTETLFFYNKMANDSYTEGINLARRQYEEAYAKIYDKITQNPYYYGEAEKAVKTIIESLVKSWNKNIPDLNVIVEVGVI